MSKWIDRMERGIACSLAFLLIVPVTLADTDSLPSAPQPQLAQGQSQPNPTGAAGQNGSQQAPQTAPANQQQTSQSQPVGTAAAPVIRPAGVPGSRPAGAAIAPAKQRRIRQIAIRVGLLVGAGIAIGTVAAASLGSPARPH